MPILNYNPRFISFIFILYFRFYPLLNYGELILALTFLIHNDIGKILHTFLLLIR